MSTFMVNCKWSAILILSWFYEVATNFSGTNHCATNFLYSATTTEKRPFSIWFIFPQLFIQFSLILFDFTKLSTYNDLILLISYSMAVENYPETPKSVVIVQIIVTGTFYCFQASNQKTFYYFRPSKRLFTLIKAPVRLIQCEAMKNETS